MRYTIQHGFGHMYYIFDTRRQIRVSMVLTFHAALRVCRDYNSIWAEYKKAQA